jgi:molybdopterin-containing oxidoreductase family iron-sulfur binding subunit
VKSRSEGCGEHAEHEREGISRRGFVQAIGTAAGLAGISLTGCTQEQLEDAFRQHYHRLTEDEKREIFARIEAQIQERYGVDVRISDPPPIEGVNFAYALNLSYCIGCRRCEYACVRENNTSRDPQIHYIRVLRLEKGSLDVEGSDIFFEGEVPQEDSFYMPVQCHQCANPPCVSACPVQATWAEPDGIVVVDYDWCIGCRYCQAACPYWARRFNFTEPDIRPEEINPDQGYLSNRLRPVGVIEKCTYCLHRVRRGRYPACVEACPTGSRKFGDLNDPNSEVRRVIESTRVYIFKEELGTIPKFFYFFD